AESTGRRFVVRTNTRRAGSAAHVRELPERLASICLGCRVVLGNDGITLYAVRQASLEQLIAITRVKTWCVNLMLEPRAAWQTHSTIRFVAGLADYIRIGHPIQEASYESMGNRRVVVCAIRQRSSRYACGSRQSRSRAGAYFDIRIVHGTDACRNASARSKRAA